MKLINWVKEHPYSLAVFSGLATILIIGVVYFLLGYAPFGEKTIAVADAEIQYHDFFAYLRNVLTGKDSLLFSFNNGLGGSTLALFAYYLASPLNLLVIFFQPGKLDVFLNIIFLLKAALAATTFAIFLIWYFRKKLEKSFSGAPFIIFLSLAYGLSQYLLAQASNILWLDGVYMLPLMMLATSKLIREQSSGVMLAVTAALSILFNWYSGGINCIFIIIWFALEMLIYFSEHSIDSKLCRKLIFRFFWSLVLAVLISGILFLPSVFAVLGSSHGTLAWKDLLKPVFIGQPMSLAARYTIGGVSEFGAVSLFCGSLGILGCLMIFLSSKITTKKKMIYGVFLAVLIMSCYFQPFVMIFSLLENVYSYWYRYSYVIIAAILFLSGLYFVQFKNKEDTKKLYILGCVIIGAIAISTYNAELTIQGALLDTSIWLTLIVLAIMIVLVGYYLKKSAWRPWLALAICVIVVGELTAEAGVFMKRYQGSVVSATNDYTEDIASLLSGIREDASEYRISQTSTRVMDEYSKTANYNEGLGFGYKSISTYTSTVNDYQLALMNQLGYRTDYEIKNIVNTSILGADSLLGVKYIMSNYPLNGLTETDIEPSSSGKKVYKNPFALPLAFTYSNHDSNREYSSNPFVFQNQIYSEILGHDIELYKPLKYKVIQMGDAALGDDQTYSVDVPAGNYAVYGNIPMSERNWGMTLDIDGEYQIVYGWDIAPSDAGLTQSVFYIPTQNGAKQSITLTLNSGSSYNIKYGEEQFYALDLDILAQTTKEILHRSAAISLSMHGLSVEIDANVQKSDQNLFVSLVRDPSWTITRNGKVVEPNYIGGAIYSIPLTEGENHIVFSYKVAGFSLGIISTLCGLFGVTVVYYLEKRKTSKR